MVAGEGPEEFALVRDFAIIMATAGAAIVLFRRLNQPPILGYLLAGLLIGPFTLPNPPVRDVETIRILADLGLVLLLYALGLEFGWRRIRQVGLGVLFVGALEILGMISLGYLLGRLLGWTAQESIFLGAALSISSSAILVKVLRDTGRLASSAGRLIVGILVVEDFAAVILLTVLSGVATTGTADIGDIGSLMMKLLIFAAAALALGGLFVPRMLQLVARLGSRETMLLASLALCFSLALLGQTLEMSAAAGAFLIGAVVGDTEEANQVTGIMEPVRDMFGALFFVSIGMLIDVHLIKDYWVPALVISSVFIAGKIVGNTVGAFLAGRGERVPLQVGMGMPQIGEFSLAMMKIGVESQAIGAFMYQVIAGVTVITSLAFPYIDRSAGRVMRLFESRSPMALGRFMGNLSYGLESFRSGLTFDNEFADRVRQAGIPVVIYLLIIVVLLAVGTFVARYAMEISNAFPVTEGMIANAIGFGTLTLCVPSAVGVYRGLRKLADEVARHLVSRNRLFRSMLPETLRRVVLDVTILLAVLAIGLWSLPLVAEMLSLGSLAAPIFIGVLAVLAVVALLTLARTQRQLEEAFGRTFLGSEDEAGPDYPISGFAAHGPAGSRWGVRVGKVGRTAVAAFLITFLGSSWAVGYVLGSGSILWFM